ncbi:TonB-dependent receptor [Microbulbifer salipaludis]|uniref:TonB-dependent receptor n=1 Tax=Microbulbifer salipaludis TaxID=187980 RepID=A0ABS3E4K8_9GAMM|nr:TonB-dependent receptor [Microbulbifer salipaludis]MBN8430212.1 TonB-dependent receptor [Microbulbifer salipaludis]
MSSTRNLRQNLARSALALAIGAATLSSQTVFADETTGAIRGAVVNVENVTKVTLTDPERGITRDVSVSADGKFRFGSLNPGKYQLQVLNADGVVDTQMVQVGLGGTTSITMGDTGVEEVTVTGERISQVDVGIAESGLVISADELMELPVARELTAVTLLAPGVSRGDSAFGNNTSFSGASVAENVSYVNGLNTTNFRNGLGFSEVPFEFYENIQVKTGGYSAKFGRSTGGVMNATTKSGTNDFKFGTNLYFDTDVDTAPNTRTAFNEKDARDETNTNVYASGALIEDRLFFYALYNRSVEDQEYYGRISGLGYQSSRETDFWGVKLDGYITEDHRVELTAFSDERETIEGQYDYDSDTDTLGDKYGNTYYERGGMNWIATYVGNLTDTLELKVSYGESEQNRTTVSDADMLPVVYEYTENAAGEAIWTPMGNWTNFLVEKGDDAREMMRVDLAWDLNDHFIEVGLDQETNTSFADNNLSGGVYWLRDPDNLYNECDIASECPSGANVRRRTYSVGGNFEVVSSAFYIQDTWRVSDNLELQAGLRNETFENKNAEGAAFIEVDNQWAPRLSAVWDPTGAGNQKVFANWGMYYLPIASNTNVRLAGGETYIHDYFDWDGDCVNADTTPCNVGDQYDQVVYADGSVPDTRGLVDTNIEPMYQSEFILGYEYVMQNGMQLGVKGMYRDLKVSIEDVAIDAAVIDYYNSNGTWDAAAVGGAPVEDVFDGFHQYVLTNPGNAMGIYIEEMDEFINLTADQLNYPEAKRQYGALEFTFKRPFDGKWAMDASYTWGHSWGNSEGYVRSDNGQDDAGLTTNFDQPGLLDGGYGNLPNDRRHTVKAYGHYKLDMGLSLGANFMWQTGRPLNCFGEHPTDLFAQDYGDESFYCDGQLVRRGSVGRTQNYWNLDLSAQYPVEFGNNQKLLLSLDVFNALNNDTITEVNESGLNPATYLEPLVYQAPRSIRLGVRYDFN